MKQKVFQATFLIAWCISVSLILGSVHSWHYADFSPDKSLMLDGIKIDPNTDFGILHFLTPTCSCSLAIYEHLLEQGPLSGASETVVVIDDNGLRFADHLRSRGFQVRSFTIEEISKKFSGGIKGVPLLIIFDQMNITRYVGGYSSQLITPLTHIDFKSYINKLREGKKLASLPVRGCTVSEEYQKLLDPLGLKYVRK